MYLSRQAMSHGQVRFESEGDGEANLIMNPRKHSRKPSALPGIGEQKDYIVLFYEFFEFLGVFKHLANRRFILPNRMPRHRDLQHFAPRRHHREHLEQSLRCDGRFEIIGLDRVFVGEETLSNRIRIRYLPGIDKRDLSVAPADEVPGDLAPKTARSEHEAAGLLEDVEVEALDLPPFHELEVEVCGVLHNILRIQLRLQIDFLRLILRELDNLLLLLILTACKIGHSVQNNFTVEAAVEAYRLLLGFFVHDLLAIIALIF